MSDRIAPFPASGGASKKLTPEQLSQINQALLRAQLAESRANESAAMLDLRRIAAREAATAFARTRAEIGDAHGVRLGETHGWNEYTGEIVPLPAEPGA